MLPQVLVIPSSSIYQGSYVYIVEDNLLKRKNVTISWQNGEESIISSGLNANEQLVLTPLGQVHSGTPVAIAGQPRSKKKGQDTTLNKQQKKLERKAQKETY